MQRTSSITRITIEVDDDDQNSGQDSDVAMVIVDGGYSYDDKQFLAMFSQENHRRNERKDDGKSAFSSSSFLGNCGFCKSRLAPSRDIYMYKGDAAFCSVECREQQIEHDEAKHRKSIVLSPSN
ncbi:hypothetical protein AALP_AA7G277000 [Arabis alpina]|uniref:FLZ-type domain-containing protein n=1 Tax=Arabis alpina TaxID=50452 RepID=A0A087GL01_ARAAL|nr:hypothetical protein AALP_AA7G277000 [Arabis alpina]